MTSALLIACALAAAGSVSMRADPGLLVGGSGQTATLEITATDDRGNPHPGPLTVTTDTGRIDEPRTVKPGSWAVTLHAPDEIHPQLAFVLAQVPGSHGWLAVPIHGATGLKVETSKPRAAVEVSIAGKTFGPVPTDENGKAELPVVVPPGVATGTATTTDTVGNRSTIAVDLKPPPLRRVALAPLGGRAAASWSDPQPLLVATFAADPDGSPSRRASPRLAASRGAVEPPRADGPGRWLSAFRAPEKVADGTVTLNAELDDSEPALHVVRLLPGPAAQIQIALEPPVFVAGSGVFPQVRPQVFDAHGNPRPDEAEIEVELGQLSPKLRWWLPNAFDGRSEAIVRAQIPGAEATARLRLQPGPAAAGEMELEATRVRAGSRLRGAARLRDAYGNPTPGVLIETAASLGRVAAFRDAGAGLYELEYRTSKQDRPGPARITLRAGGSTLVLESPVEVLAAEPGWKPALGGVVWAGTSVDGRAVRTWAISGHAELALRPGKRRFELAADIGFRRAARLDEDVSDEFGPGATLTARTLELSMAGLARWLVPWRPRVEWSLGAGAGMRVLWGRPRIIGGAIGTETQEQRVLSGQVLLSGGARVRTGPGRVTAELQYAWLPLPSDPELMMHGDIGGLGLALGYLVDL